MGRRKKKRGRRWVWITAGVIFLAIGGAAAAVTYNFSRLTKQTVEYVGKAYFGAPVKVGWVLVSPLGSRITLFNLKVANGPSFKDGELMTIERLSVKLDAWSLFKIKEKVYVHEIDISGPVVRYEGDLNHSNLDKIAQNIQFPAQSWWQAPLDRTFEVDSIVVNEAIMDVYPNSSFANPMTLVLPNIEIKRVGLGEGATAQAIVLRVINEMREKVMSQIASNPGLYQPLTRATVGKILGSGPAEFVNGILSIFGRGINSADQKIKIDLRSHSPSN